MVRVSQQLYLSLLTLCKNTALKIVVGAGRGEGLEAWKLLVERYEPRLRTRYATQFMKIKSFSLQGDLLERLGLWEREIQLYENGSGKELRRRGVPHWNLHAPAPWGAHEDPSSDEG